MTARMRPYETTSDSIRVRDFLNETYAAFAAPVNWGLERWNYARYFVAPMVGAYGAEEGRAEGSLRAIQAWEDLARIWEDDAGRIVGVTCVEHPDPAHEGLGEIFVQRHPQHVDLLDEMVAFGEENYTHPEKNRVYLWAYEDDRDLIGVLEARGFARRAEPVSHHLEFAIGDLPPLELPDGFRLLSMLETNDIERRREVLGRAFHHEQPKEWPSAFSYRELQRAPDYHLENDLVIAAPDGTYVACCIVWYDGVNRIAHLEPLGTHPEHRRQGLAMQILLAALQRAKELGATRMPMTGGFEPFYRAAGFVERRKAYTWVKRLQECGARCPPDRPV